MLIAEYLDKIVAQFKSGKATEHSYRPALTDLFRSIVPKLTVINEPKKSEAGMPDFLFERDGVPIGWAEAKDIDKDVIRLKGYSVEQRKRYEAAYPNLIYTNGVDFEFIRDGVPVHFVSIADFSAGLQPLPQNFDELGRQLCLFAEQKPISIRSASSLAKMMAAKAAIIKDEITLALKEDPEYRSGLGGQFKSFKANLLPHLEPNEFADIYAETITYGMFAARFHDDDLATFSRQEAMEKLPASNPFLKGLFEYVAGPALPKRLTYIVDDLVEVMRASDPQSLFRDFGKFTARNDPFIHFYEDFLAAYNPSKRKSRGVWYTPEPVVDFIIRGIDDVLKTEFGLPDGLADTSKVTVTWDTGQNDNKGKAVTEKRQVHKVQILDPATGTGTFLAKAVQLISERVKVRAPGKWSGYVEEDLLPRLHGFELLMASYAMCHMKLDMQLTQSGYKPSAKPPRLSVWLTNSLEPAEREVRDLFFQPLAEEARGASQVKRQTPIMCVIGNPPYSGESVNKSDHIMALMEAYKKEPGGKEKLKERNPKWINDDYVKFIRAAEDLIVKNKSGGILGFITNHGYLDNPTFRGMRWHLLRTFDKIWILDLHGNSNKKETSPDGSPDVNVFDIMPGVAIFIGVRKPGESVPAAEVRHADLWGSRASKGERLTHYTLNNIDRQIIPRAPEFAFVDRDHPNHLTYDSGFSIAVLFRLKSVGIVTARDGLTTDFSLPALKARISDFAAGDVEVLRSKYKLGKDARDWRVSWAQEDVRINFSDDRLTEILFYPFDYRWTLYTGKSRGFICYPRDDVMGQMTQGPNLALHVPRQCASEWRHSFVSNHISAFNLTGNAGRYGASYVYPLYRRNAGGLFDLRPNFDPKLYATICRAAGINPNDRAGPEDDFCAATGDGRASEVKVFDYIYGVLHSEDYRATYAEFLKIDFPRIPYPPSSEVFRHVSQKGEALRRLHLMEGSAVGNSFYPYHGDGDDTVAAGYPKFTRSRVYINRDQYFDGVPEVAWSFFIGGYQPAQKWLKDRRGRCLSWDDIVHYQKIIKILSETNRIKNEITLPLTNEEQEASKAR